MINRQTFDAVRQQYGHCASWAVWASEDDDSQEECVDCWRWRQHPLA